MAVEPETLSGERLRTTCHDMLNLLASLIMNVEMLAMPAQDGAAREEAAADACASVDRLTSIIRDLQVAVRDERERAA